MKNFLFLVIGLGLLACRSMDHKHTIPALHPNNIIEEQVTYVNYKYLSLLDIVERMRVFIEEESVSRIYPIWDEDDANEELAWLSGLKEVRQNQIGFITEIYEQTLQLLQNKQDINEYLFFLLTTRYGYLQGRQQGIERTLQATDNLEVYLLPTSKELFDFVMEDSLFSKHATSNELSRIYAVRRYELLNLLIKETFAKCTLAELAPKTLMLLRTSVQLHPILTGERQNLGHPDEAGGWYALLEPIVLHHTRKTGRNKYLPKLCTLLDTANLLKAAKKVPSGCNTLFLKFLFYDITHNKDLETTQALLELKKDLDLEIHNAHFVFQDYPLLLRNIGTPPTHIFKVFTTAYEADIWPYELPDPAFLKKSQESLINELSIKTLAIENDAIMTGCISAASSLTQEVIAHSVELMQDSLAAPVAASPIASTLSQPQPAPDLVEQPKDLAAQPTATFSETKPTLVAALTSPIASTLLQTEPDLVEKPEHTPTPPATVRKVQEPTSQAFLFTRDWSLPKGLRSFHDKMLQVEHPVLHVLGQHQKVLDRLFDPQQQCKVTFKDIESLWKSVGGTILSNHGGSHRELVTPQGEKLFGIFAHNSNQAYGKNYIKYVLTALLYIGLRPTQGIEKNC